MKQKSVPHMNLSSVIDSQNTLLHPIMKKQTTISPRLSLNMIEMKPCIINHPSSQLNPQLPSLRKKRKEIGQFSAQEKDNVTEISIDSSIEQNVFGKIEKLLNRSNDDELKQSETKKIQLEMIGKDKYTNKFIIQSNTSIKSIESCERTQKMEQISSSELTFILSKFLSPIWQIIISKPFEIEYLQSDTQFILDTISAWENINFRNKSNIQKIISMLEVTSIQQAFEKIEKYSSTDKEESILKLNDKINSEYQQSTIYVEDSKISFISTNTEYVIQENFKLKQEIEKLESQKRQLTLALQKDFGSIKSNIIEQVQSKIQLTNSLLAAESYMENLKKATDQQIQTLQQIIQRQREATARFMQTVSNETRYKQKMPTILTDGSISLTDLQFTIQEQIRSCQYLSSKLDEAQQHIAYLQNLLAEVRRVSNEYYIKNTHLEDNQNKYYVEKQYFKDQITSLNSALKQCISNKQSIQNQTIQAQINELNSNVHQIIANYKNINDKQKVSSEQNTISHQEQLQKIIKSKSNKFHSLDRSHAILRNQSNFGKLKLQKNNVSAGPQIPHKQNKRKVFERIKLITGLDKSEEISPEVLKTSRQLNLECSHKNEEQLNTLQNSYKRMRSLCLQSLNISSNDDGRITDRSGSKMNESNSELSLCWKETSSIKNLATRIDSQSQLKYEIEDIFEKFDFSGEIPSVIKSFLKKLEDYPNKSLLLNKIEQFLGQLSQVMILQQFDRQNNQLFLKEQFDKMGSIFNQIHNQSALFLEQKYEIRNILPEQNPMDQIEQGVQGQMSLTC